MSLARRLLVLVIALVMASMVLAFAIYAFQRYNQGDDSLVCLIAVFFFAPFLLWKLLEPLHVLLFARRVVRGFSGLSGYRRKLPKDR
ncbi:MAG: hypothetical protein ABI700_03255 [Chloroflexota bacterium]